MGGISLSRASKTEGEYQSIYYKRYFQQCNPQSLTFVLLVVWLHCVTQHTFVLIWDNSSKHHSTVNTISTFSYSYSCEALKMSLPKYEPSQNRLTFIQILLQRCTLRGIWFQNNSKLIFVFLIFELPLALISLL